MKVDSWILVVAIVGVLVLFMFPSPEENFGWYVLTALGFVVLGGILFWFWKR